MTENEIRNKLIECSDEILNIASSEDLNGFYFILESTIYRLNRLKEEIKK